MGSPANSSSLQTTIKMKSVAVAALCLFAAVAADAEAKPEAEADAYYGHYGLPRSPWLWIWPRSPRLLWVCSPLAYGHYYGKRSADAEPAAEAAAEPAADAYYGRYGYGLAHHGYGYGLAHHGYYGYAHPYAYGRYYGKRSADAEPAAEAAAEPAADAYYGHYGYGL